MLFLPFLSNVNKNITQCPRLACCIRDFAHVAHGPLDDAAGLWLCDESLLTPLNSPRTDAILSSVCSGPIENETINEASLFGMWSHDLTQSKPRTSACACKAEHAGIHDPLGPLLSCCWCGAVRQTSPCWSSPPPAGYIPTSSPSCLSHHIAGQSPCAKICVPRLP